MGFIGNSPNSSKVVPLGDDTKAVQVWLLPLKLIACVARVFCPVRLFYVSFSNAQVSSTLNHTLIVTNNGKCYTYNPETDNLRKIVKFSNVEISHTVMFTGSKLCYPSMLMWKDFHLIYLSLQDSEDPVEDPIINVSCGGHTNLALSKTGNTHVFENSYVSDF